MTSRPLLDRAPGAARPPFDPAPWQARSLVAEAQRALDAAQYVCADGTLLVDAEAAAQRCTSIALRLDESAAALAGRARDTPALDPASSHALAALCESVCAAALAQRAMAERLRRESHAAWHEAQHGLDRLDERLAVLEAYAQRDAQALATLDAEPPAAVGPEGPAAALRRRLEALVTANDQCADTLRRLEAARRLPPALRVRAAAAGLRISALRICTRTAWGRVDRWLRWRAGAGPVSARCRATDAAARG
jgi:hypothetical protein